MHGEIMKSFRISVGKYKRTRQLGRLWLKIMDTIKMDLGKYSAEKSYNVS
jgi:hypothetical protein